MANEIRVEPMPTWAPSGKPASAWSLFVEHHPVLVFTLPAAVVVFVLMVFPVFYTVYMSLHSWFAICLTLYFTALATALQVVLGVSLALLLNRPFRGKGFFRSIFLLPMVATPVAIALVWMMMYNPTLGVMNYLVGLV